ncbi:thiamine permease [Actinomadura sp. KC06]|uniref:purine-cytosine permease family protein n=1 Tax=Actinomadura sp. KC06 TaxID=2530369 RepID=UPI00104469EF|nr:thiamine permease [Actinomadura sp. KC06]TDD34232.1 thiamine permease [Actinomadura sp. KC06]
MAGTTSTGHRGPAPTPPALVVSHTDDPEVALKAASEDYSNHVVPLTWRSGRFSLTMAWWAMASAMFWLVAAATVAVAVGTRAALAGMVLAVITHSAITSVLSTYAARTGLTVALLSRRLFGLHGAIIAPVVFGATAVYYSVFEGSVIAIALHRHFGGLDIKIYYLIVVLYSVPMVFGGVRTWLDRFNGFLLPFYLAGLSAAIVWATVEHDAPAGWLSAAGAVDLPVPGWMFAYATYLGMWIMMMYTFDFARFGRPQDVKFHRTVTFGPVFYTFIFLISGLIGIFLTKTVPTEGPVSEVSVVYALVDLMGITGVILIWVSQTRINTANFYLASTNLGMIMTQVLRVRLPRTVWSVVTGVLVYLLMLTDVLSYLLTALAWQSVVIVAWVGIAVVHIITMGDDGHGLPEFRPGRVRRVTPGLAVWLLAATVGILLVETGGAAGTSWAPIVTLAISVMGYLAVQRLPAQMPLDRPHDPRAEVEDVWDARVRCGNCGHSYIAVEIDRDPSAGHAAICAPCAGSTPAFHAAARAEARSAPIRTPE